jgi:hypothetical protein
MTDDRNLDAALAAWARHDAGDDATLARILAHADAVAASPPPAARPRWLPYALGSAALAASIAIALLLSPQVRQQAPGAGVETAPAEVMMASTDPELESFAMLHTLTTEEEQYL